MGQTVSQICTGLGLGTSATELDACRLLEQRGSEPEGYISSAEVQQLEGILRGATPELRPRIANALLNGLARPGNAPGRVSAGAGVEPMLRSAAQATVARPAGGSDFDQLMTFGMNQNARAFENRVTGTIMSTAGGLTTAASIGGIVAITAGVITAPAWVPIALGVTAVAGTAVAIWGAVKMFSW